VASPELNVVRGAISFRLSKVQGFARNPSWFVAALNLTWFRVPFLFSPDSLPRNPSILYHVTNHGLRKNMIDKSSYFKLECSYDISGH
jgi:hypothetical protein